MEGIPQRYLPQHHYLRAVCTLPSFSRFRKPRWRPVENNGLWILYRRSSENFPLFSVCLCCLVSRWVSLAGGLKGLRNSRDLPLASAHLKDGYRCKLESSTINLNYRPCCVQMEIKGQFDAGWAQYLQREPAARKRNSFSSQGWQIKKPKWCQGWRQVWRSLMVVEFRVRVYYFLHYLQIIINT